MAPSVAEWVLDTVAAVHMTGNLLLLRDGRDLITYDLQEIADALPTGGPHSHRCGDILGCGSVKTDRIEVPNVRYVQGLTVNLFSVGQLAREHSLEFAFEPRYCYIRKKAKSGGQIVGRARCAADGRYVLEYLRVGLKDDASLNTTTASLNTTTGTNDDDDNHDEDEDGSPTQAGPDPDSWFGLSLSDIPTVNSCCDHVCTGRSTLLPQIHTPSQHFYMDSGACCHSTGDPSVLQRYPGDLKINPPIPSLGGVVNGPGTRVDGCGYVNNNEMQLDGVLYTPDSSANLVSVGQLVKQYDARAVFEKNFFSVQRMPSKETIGQGHRIHGGNHYALDSFQPGVLFINSGVPTDVSVMFGNIQRQQQPS